MLALQIELLISALDLECRERGAFSLHHRNLVAEEYQSYFSVSQPALLINK
jgi:hypothetical protein